MSNGLVVSFLITHLFIVIVVVVKISKQQKGALRMIDYSSSLIEYIFYTDKGIAVFPQRMLVYVRLHVSV